MTSINECPTCQLWKQEVETAEEMWGRASDPMWCGVQLMLYFKKGFFIYGVNNDGQKFTKAFSTPESESLVKKLLSAMKDKEV